MKKIDFAQTLLRRRVSLQRFLENEQISDWRAFSRWMRRNEMLWSFSEALVAEAKAILQGPVVPQVAPDKTEPVAAAPEVNLPSADALVEPAQEMQKQPRSPKTTKTVQSPPKEE